MKKLIISIMAVTALCLAGCGIFGGDMVYAAICPADAPNQAAKTPAECFVAPPDGTETDAMKVVKNILTAVIGIVGVVAVIMMIIGGIFFMTAQGDAPKITRARNTILYGLVGLVIALLSFAIVNFVIGKI